MKFIIRKFAKHKNKDVILVYDKSEQIIYKNTNRSSNANIIVIIFHN